MDEQENALKRQIAKIELAEAQGVTTTKTALAEKNKIYERFYNTRINELEAILEENKTTTTLTIKQVEDIEDAIIDAETKKAQIKTQLAEETAKNTEKLAKESAKAEIKATDDVTGRRKENWNETRAAGAATMAALLEYLVNINISMEEAEKRVARTLMSYGNLHVMAVEKLNAYKDQFNRLSNLAGQYGITLDTHNKSLAESIELFKQKLSLSEGFRGSIDSVVDSAKNLNESIREWQSGINATEGLKVKFGELASKLTDLALKAGSFNSLLSKGFGKVSSDMSSMGKMFPQLSDAVSKLKDELAASHNKSQEQLDEIISTYEEMVSVGTEYVEALKTEFDTLESVNDDLVASISDVKNTYKELADEFAKSGSNNFISGFFKLNETLTSNDGMDKTFEKIANAIEDMYKKIREVMPALRDEYRNSIQEVNNLLNANRLLSNVTVEDVTVLKDKIVASYTEMFASIKEKIDGMKSLWDSLKEKVIEITDKIKDVQEGTDSIILELRKKTMSEEKQYNADRKRFEELVTKAKEAEGQKQYDIAEKYYTQATEIAKSLAVEVKDTNGKVIQSLENSINNSIKMITRVSGWYEDMLRKQRIEVNNQAKAAESSLNSILDLAETASKTYETKLTQAQDLVVAKQKEFTAEILKTNEAIRELVALLDQQFKGPIADSIFKDKSKKSQMFAEGGRVNVPGAPTSRDTIPAMLSNNEFVISNRAVQKYGAGFFNALNNMSIPTDIMSGITSGLSKLKSGINGYLKGGFVKPQFAFASGGLVGAGNTNNTSTSNSYYTGNFTINGAGKQAKEIAIEVDKILVDRARYNRSSFYNMVR
jgi:hypothetical protein